MLFMRHYLFSFKGVAMGLVECSVLFLGRCYAVARVMLEHSVLFLGHCYAVARVFLGVARVFCAFLEVLLCSC